MHNLTVFPGRHGLILVAGDRAGGPPVECARRSPIAWHGSDPESADRLRTKGGLAEVPLLSAPGTTWAKLREEFTAARLYPQTDRLWGDAKAVFMDTDAFRAWMRRAEAEGPGAVRTWLRKKGDEFAARLAGAERLLAIGDLATFVRQDIVYALESACRSIRNIRRRRRPGRPHRPRPQRAATVGHARDHPSRQARRGSAFATSVAGWLHLRPEVAPCFRLIGTGYPTFSLHRVKRG